MAARHNCMLITCLETLANSQQCGRKITHKVIPCWGEIHSTMARRTQPNKELVFNPIGRVDTHCITTSKSPTHNHKHMLSLTLVDTKHCVSKPCNMLNNRGRSHVPPFPLPLPDLDTQHTRNLGRCWHKCSYHYRYIQVCKQRRKRKEQREREREREMPKKCHIDKLTSSAWQRCSFPIPQHLQ